MLKRTLITSRDPKGLHAMSLFESAYNRLKLDEGQAQCLNEHGGEFQEGVASLIKQLIGINPNSAYPKEYTGSKPIEDQVKMLADTFNLDSDFALNFVRCLPELPERAEGWFAILSNTALAKLFPSIRDEAERYCHAVRLVHDKIAATRSFINERDQQITPEQLKLSFLTDQAIKKIAEIQKGDFLIVAAQLGECHYGKSVRQTREAFSPCEFGLGSLAAGTIILTHPERLVRLEQLDIDCTGDEFSPNADGNFCRTPYYYFNNGSVKYSAGNIDYISPNCGPISAFLSVPA